MLDSRSLIICGNEIPGTLKMSDLAFTHEGLSCQGFKATAAGRHQWEGQPHLSQPAEQGAPLHSLANSQLCLRT